MNFLRSITVRVTLWYLAILSVLLVFLGCGVYLTLSTRLHNNLDASLKERAIQLTGFNDIMSIVAGGTFEDQEREYITFYYYSDGRLSSIAPRGRVFPVKKDLIDRALSGETCLTSIEIPKDGLYRVYISPFKPDNPIIRPDRFSEKRQKSERRPNRKNGMIREPRRDDGMNRGPRRGAEMDRGPGREDEMGRGPGRDDEMGRGPRRNDEMGRGPERNDEMGRRPRRDDEMGRGPGPDDEMGHGPERNDEMGRGPRRDDEMGRGPKRDDEMGRGPGRDDEMDRDQGQDVESYRPPRRDERSETPKDQDERVDQTIKIESAVLVIARPTGDIESTLDQLLHILCFAVPLTLLLSVGGGSFLAHRALKPVKQIANAARRIEEGDLSRRIKLKTKDELGYLAETLNQMIERLERAFKRQKEFTSDASHELRGPLSVIQAEATLALRKPRDAEGYRKTIEVIAGEAEHMAALTQQLLELARADSGKEVYRFETLNLNDFVQNICADMDILCREKGLELKMCLSPSPLHVNVDIKSMRRLIFNIVNNAIKYTDQGIVSVSIKNNNKNNTAVISISDTGMGIPEDSLPFIFKRFYRVDKSRSRSEGSSGLGLAICKHIIDIHKGQIAVESRIGKGSTFTIQIPAAVIKH